MRIRSLKLHNQPRYSLCQCIMQIAGHTLAFTREGQLLHFHMRFLKITQEILNPEPFLNLLKEQ
ncbi:hypothetical protein D3C81_1995890 [compost metagenome]